MNLSEKTLSIASALYPSLNSSLEGISMDLFFWGCRRRCKGCHNPELQEFKPPNISIQTILDKIDEYDVHLVTLLGGEPLDQPKQVILDLLDSLKQKGVQINLYTGYELSEVDPDILAYMTSIKTGAYVESLKTKPGSFLASSNQKYYCRDSNGIFMKLTS